MKNFNKQNNKRKTLKFSTKDIAITAIMLAFMLVSMFIPIKIGPVSIAVLPILVVAIACQVKGLKIGLAMGLAFGIVSLLASLTTGNFVIFGNPLISIFPRVMVSILSYFTYVGLRKVLAGYAIKKNKPKNTNINILISSGISSMVGAITNTVLVLGMMFAFQTVQNIPGVSAIIIASLSLNAPIEWAVALVATPFITLALRKFLKLSEIETLHFAQKSCSENAVNDIENKDNYW